MLLDPGSFVELDALTRHRSTNATIPTVPQTGQGELAQAVAATPPGDAWPDLGRQCRDGGFARPS
jgi:hypothetical protein